MFERKLQVPHLAMGQKLWLHFGVGEHPFATYFTRVSLGFDPEPLRGAIWSGGFPLRTLRSGN